MILQVGLGGPLVCPQQDGRYVVTGASSWDVGCSERKAPSVLCAVDINWVNEVLARPLEDFIHQSEDRIDPVAPEVAQQKPGFAQGYGK
jgi:secreted trypsin-like serine protease